MKTLRIGSSLTALGLLAGLAACGGDGQGPNTRPLSQDEQGLVQAANDFGFRLLEEVAAEQGQDNLFISPLSVSLALGMTYNGARGETEQAMRQTLGLGELSREQINDGYRGLIDLLCELDPKVTVEIANSIWYRDGFDVLQAFVEVNVEHFDAVVRALDFADAGAADTINAWVSEKTHGKIDEIVEPPINAATVMFLINAVYFKGDWMLQFDPEDTREQAFHGPGGARQVPMMNMHTELAYLETDRAQIVDLPYGHGLYSMTVVLPKPEVDRAELIAGLDRNRWQQWMNGLVEQELTLALPRFELEYEKVLNDALIALGMGVAFGGAADFTGIRESGGLYISRVKHKSYVKVDEVGTEAAAVTSVEVRETSISNAMIADRPFLFVIHDKHSGALLFMGQIVDPAGD